jgi:catechol 2,3-dioxygenase-like lactoylglutathione lyase family enzyme
MLALLTEPAVTIPINHVRDRNSFTPQPVLQTVSCMFKQIDYVMIGVSDMDKSVGFYKDTLGMPLKYKTNEWTEFQTGATTLALHLSKPRIISAAPQREMVAGTSTIGFTVSDLDKTYQKLKAKNVRFVMEPKMREQEGIKLAVCLDPDGLEISISETVKQPMRAEAHANY